MAGYSTSMQNLSAMNFTMIGGSTRSLGFSPMVSNFFRYGRHQLISTFTLTPAFILTYFSLFTSHFSLNDTMTV